MKTNPSFPTLSYRVEKSKIKPREKNIFLIDTPSILFNPYGCTIELRAEEKEVTYIKKEEMIFLFPAIVCSFSVEEETDVFLFFLPEAPLFYFRYISTFFPQKSQPKEMFYPLSMDHFVKNFIFHLAAYLKDNILHPELIKIKSAELFFLLNTSYNKEKLSAFFYPILTREHHFKAIVLASYKEVKTVEELAGKCNLSVPAFSRLFQNTFGTSPYKWMQKKKTERLYETIYESNIPLKEVADITGFSSLSQMIDYCKKHIGYTPGEIRKKRIAPDFL